MLFLMVSSILLSIYIQRTESISFKEYETQLPVEKFLDSIGVKFPLIVLAQSIEETTQDGKIFNSTICRNNFNHFGMKFNRRGYARDTRYGHARYDGPLDSFLDYKAWQKYMLDRVKYPVETEEDYFYFLEHLPTNKDCTGRYAENRRYVTNLKYYLKKLKQLKFKKK